MTDSRPGRRPGRPPLPAGEARSERVVTFLTPSELVALKHLAAASGTSISATCHALLASSLATPPLDHHLPEKDDHR